MTTPTLLQADRLAGEAIDSYLIRGAVHQYGRGLVVYEGVPAYLYLVLEGIVRVSRYLEGRDVPMHCEFVLKGELLGESCLLPQSGASYERADAFQPLVLMRWKPEQALAQILERPEIVTGLARSLSRKAERYRGRLCHLQEYTMIPRLAANLLRLAEEMGSPQERGYVHLRGFTHDVLASVVGTSRELISKHLSDLRRAGLLEYRHLWIQLHPAQLQVWLSTQRQTKGAPR